MAEKEKLLQWHAAFFAGIQVELEEEAEYLTFFPSFSVSKQFF